MLIVVVVLVVVVSSWSAKIDHEWSIFASVARRRACEPGIGHHTL